MVTELAIIESVLSAFILSQHDNTTVRRAR